MGQKVHPYGFRVGITRDWHSRWLADKKHFGQYVVEDQRIRKHVKKRLFFAGIAMVEIERTGDNVTINLHVSQPGRVIGRRGAEIDRLRNEIAAFTGKKVALNIREVQRPQVNAQLVAENIASQLVKRFNFRRAMHRAIETVLEAGAQGAKVVLSGRLGGAEMSRRERLAVGKLPLHTLDAEVDYGFAEARTTYGVVGVKVWVYCPEKEEKKTAKKPT